MGPFLDFIEEARKDEKGASWKAHKSEEKLEKEQVKGIIPWQN